MSAVASVASHASVLRSMSSTVLRQPPLRIVASDDVDFVALGAAAAQIIQSLTTKVVASNRE
jgi:hypothetical protein